MKLSFPKFETGLGRLHGADGRKHGWTNDGRIERCFENLPPKTIFIARNSIRRLWLLDRRELVQIICLNKLICRLVYINSLPVRCFSYFGQELISVGNSNRLSCICSSSFYFGTLADNRCHYMKNSLFLYKIRWLHLTVVLRYDVRALRDYKCLAYLLQFLGKKFDTQRGLEIVQTINLS